MIEFTEDYLVKPDGPFYAKGSRHSMRAASEQHFVRKGVAVVSDGVVVPEPVVEKKPEPAAVIEEPSSASPQAPASPAPTAKPRGRPKRQLFP